MIEILDVAAVGEGGLLDVETYKLGVKTIIFFYLTYRAEGNYMNKVTGAVLNGGLCRHS